MARKNKKEQQGEERRRQEERQKERGRKEWRGDKGRRKPERGEERRRKEERGEERRRRKEERGEERRRKEQRGKEEKRRERGKKYNQWLEERMSGAMEEYKVALEEGVKLSVRFLSRAWNLPRATLQRRVNGKVVGCDHVSGRKQYLPEAAEKELSALLKTMAERGFPLTKRDVQQLAFQYASQNQIKGFSQKAGRAGYYWFQNFIKRNPGLGMRKPEILSAARAAGLNKQVVSQWFQEYENLLCTLGLEGIPSHLWNCDESGLQDQFSSTKVVGKIGQPCMEVCSGEKGETTTCLAAFNAEGTYSHTMVIFKGKRLRAEWLQQCPENVTVRVSDNGWINADLFMEWGQLFVQSLPKDDARPHILLLDGHSSHVYNLDFINLMKSKNIHILCYPPHTTHALQPADKALFRSLKHHWDQEGRKWTRLMAGQKLPKSEFFSVFSRAWKKAATVENAQAGFRGTGMFPLNKHILPESAFAPSMTTERTLPPTLPSAPSRPQSPPALAQQTADSIGPIHHPATIPEAPPLFLFQDDEVVYEELVGSSESVPEEETALFNIFTPQEEQPSTSTSVTFSDLCPLPKRERTMRKRTKPPSFVLTSQEHLEYISTKVMTSKKKEKADKSRKIRQGKKKEEDVPCKACQALYGDPSDPKATEEWVSCGTCRTWFHESCGEENGICDDDGFFCQDCL